MVDVALLPRRGKPAPFLAKHVVVTSSQTPAQIYNKRAEEDSLEQLLRRVTVIDLTPAPANEILPWQSQFVAGDPAAPLPARSSATDMSEGVSTLSALESSLASSTEWSPV